MSRIANNPVQVPSGVEIQANDASISVKGTLGVEALDLPPGISVKQEDGVVRVEGPEDEMALRGTIRAHIANMVKGVSNGFERRLQLVGVGYRAQVQGSSLNLTLGFSHPVDYQVPSDITIETPSQTEIVVKGSNKQRVCQVAAKIRGYRPPEPYKGKGVRYQGERIIMKEAKKA